MGSERPYICGPPSLLELTAARCTDEEVDRDEAHFGHRVDTRDVGEAIDSAITALEGAVGGAPPGVAAAVLALAIELGEWRSIEGAGRTILVAPDGRWVTTPLGTKINLGGRPVRRRVVEVLLDCLVRMPGQPQTGEQLAAAVWPDADSRSKTRTLAVALTRLRADGLDEVLMRIEGGYLLNPTLRVRRV